MSLDEEEDGAKGDVTKTKPSGVKQGTVANSPRTEQVRIYPFPFN